VFVPCVHCIEEDFEEPYLFSLEECETYAVTGKQFINCRQQGLTPVSLDRLVPDLTLKDFDGSKISYAELEVGDPIGEGGAATVYQGKFRGKPVAIKKLNIMEEVNNDDEVENAFSVTFQEFRREVAVMR
jgi:hypothetical protein